MKNSSALFRILVPSSTHKDPLEGITSDNLRFAEAAIDKAVSRLPESRADRLIQDEFSNAAAMLRHACRRGMWKLDPTSQSTTQLADDIAIIIAEHRRLWLARNRTGGLDDSAARLEANLAEYVGMPNSK
jgi:hypothetical protein